MAMMELFFFSFPFFSLFLFARYCPFLGNLLLVRYANAIFLSLFIFTTSYSTAATLPCVSTWATHDLLSYQLFPGPTY